MELDENAVETFLTKFKASDNDKRVDQVQMFGLQLESTSSLPESTLDAITLLLAPTLRSSNHLLIQSTLTSFLPFFIPHIPSSTQSQAQTHLKLALVQFLPPLLEKLNDPKEKIANPARLSVGLFGKKCFEAESGIVKDQSVKGKEKESLVGYWERNVKDNALAGKGWRGKVEGMKLILGLKGEVGGRMSLKPWLANLVELLEDGDSNVRETARETLVALLTPAGTPPGAKSELKKLLQARQIRASIADNIITRVFAASSTMNTPASEVPPSLDDPGLVSRSGAATPAGDEVPIVYVANARDIESEFAQMLPPFQGRETEHNWNPREKAVIHLRGMLRGQAFEQFPEAFVSGLKSGFFEGLSKTIVSLRTTVSQQSCALMQELAEALGSAFDPFVENVLPILAKMAGYTKKSIADKSQRALSTIITHSTAHPRLFISHIHAGMQDKNVQTRTYATGHLKNFIDTHAAKHRQTIENTSHLLDTLVDCTKKGLSDVNPGVREIARPAFWAFSAIWPKHGELILGELDPTQKKQLDKVRPEEIAPIATAPTRPSIGAAKKSSGIGALLAEKRRAAMAARQDTQRTVSSPVPGSPSLGGGRIRSVSQSDNTHDDDPADESPVKANGTSSNTLKPLVQETPKSKMANMSLGSPSNESPSRSPLAPKSSSSSDPMSASSSVASQALKAPSGSRTSLVSSTIVPPDQGSPQAKPSLRQPVTPARPGQSSKSLFPQTPMNGHGGNVWEDSPGPTAVTPMMVDKLKGRRHERSWWLKRQQYLDKASPFKTTSPAPASAVETDVEALQAGTPELRNLQKLTLFSTSHPISTDEDEVIWSEGKLFSRVFDGLVGYLRPERGTDLLEHGLVLLWELVQHQWALIEGQEAVLVDCLFTLRSSRNATILESTNSLISLLTEICDPVYLLGLLRASLGRYLAQQVGISSNGNGHLEGESQQPSKALASGYLFGLNGMGMCILRLPAPVVEVEAPKLASIITDATTNTSSEMLSARQAVHHLLLCIQCVVKDSQRTLAMFPDLPEAQKNLGVYLMGQNGLLPGGGGTPEKVMHEMVGLMARGSA